MGRRHPLRTPDGGIRCGEALLTARTGASVVCCRLREDDVRIETGDAERARVTPGVVAAVLAAMRAVDPGIRSAVLDREPYRPGRAFTLTPVRS